MTDLFANTEMLIIISIVLLVLAAILIRIYLVRLFSRFDAAYAVCAYFIKYNKDLYGIIGPIVETKELPTPIKDTIEYRRYDFAVTGQQMSGILKCDLLSTVVGFNTKWRMKKAVFVPENGEEIELKV